MGESFLNAALGSRRRVPRPEDVDAVTTDDEQPITAPFPYTALQDPRVAAYETGAVVGPPDTRPIADVRVAADAAWNADRARHRSESTRRALRLGEQIRSTAEAETGSDYAPMVLALNALNVPGLGLADEGFAAIAAGLDPEMDYADAHRAVEDNLAIGATESPWSAGIGTAAGMAMGLPLSDALAPAAGLRTSTALAQSAARPALAGSVAGGVSGYARAPEGQEWQSAAQGAAMGAAFGGVGGAMAGGGRLIRGGPPESLLRAIAGASAEGAGYGLLATPGTSSHTILEPGGLALEAPFAMGTGAAAGGLLTAGSRALSLAPRAVAGLQRAQAERPSAGARGTPDFVDIDEATLDAPNLAAAREFDAVDEAGLGPEADQIAARVLAERNAEPWARRLLREAFETPSENARLRQVGLMDRRQQRQIFRSFGGPERTIAALREAGLARPGLASQASQIQAAEAIAPAMQRDLARMHRRVELDERPIAGGDIADQVDELADAYDYNISSPRELALARNLRARADDFRYGSEGPRPEATESSLSDVDGGADFDAPVAELPPEIEISYRDLRRAMDGQRIQNSRANSGPASDLTPEQESGVDVYRAQMDIRNRELQQTLGGDYPAYQRRNAAFRAANMITDGTFALRNPASMLGQLSGMSLQNAGGLPGRVVGELEQRLIGQYRDSILATLNEIGTHPQETLAMQPRIVRLLEWAATPGAPINVGGVTINRDAASIARAIESGARNGTGPATVAALETVMGSRRLPQIEARQASTPEARDEEAAFIRAEIARRNAELLQRLVPSQAAETVVRPGDADVDQDYVRERNARLLERLRRRATPTTPTRETP